MSGPNCASEGTATFGLSCKAGAAVAALALLSGACMPIASKKQYICERIWVDEQIWVDGGKIELATNRTMGNLIWLY